MPCTLRPCLPATYLTTGVPKNLGPLGQALGSGPGIERLSFEAQFPTGLPGNPPNLDVALRLPLGEVWAIESKFTEPFASAKRGPVFKDKYFPLGQPVWSERGLIRCAAVASVLQKGDVVFQHLDAAQLLKHALGLQVNHPGHFTLVYLYADQYADQEASEPKLHRSEIDRFGTAVAGDFPFVPLPYRTFLTKLRSFAGEAHNSYFEWIAERYRFLAIEQVHAAY